MKRLGIWNGGDVKCVIWLNVSFCGLMSTWLCVSFLSAAESDVELKNIRKGKLKLMLKGVAWQEEVAQALNGHMEMRWRRKVMLCWLIIWCSGLDDGVTVGGGGSLWQYESRSWC